MTKRIKPTERHPLVIDPETRLARLATQDDIYRLEAICSAYNILINDTRALVERAEETKERANRVYGRNATETNAE